MTYQYRLLQPKDDYKEAVIEKAGITAEFTLAEVEAIQAHNKKALRETEGQLEIKKAEIVNIDHFHPMIKELTGPQLTAAWIYKEALDYIQKAEPTIKRLNEAIAENDAMTADVMKTLGFVPTELPVKDDQHEQA